MSYWINRDERLEYQKMYNIYHADEIKEYQKQYYLNVLKPIRSKHKEQEYKPLPEYKIKLIKRVIKNKIRAYKKYCFENQQAIERENLFIMTF
jgi:hypothetical protein